MTDEQPRYRLTFRALASDVPAERRLARLVKAALRWFGFRCEKAEELPPEEKEEKP